MSKFCRHSQKTLLINNQYFDDMLKGYGLPSGPEDIRDEYLNQCGSVSIGNNFASNQLGTDITVIIVGDILNVGNSCGGRLSEIRGWYEIFGGSFERSNGV